MANGLDLGDVPTWLTAAVPAAVLYVEGRRRSRVADLGRTIEQLVDSTETLSARVLEDEEVEELIIRAVEDAARTTWQEKVEALGRVVASAVEGDDTTVSTALLIEATLSRLERPHALALTHLAEAGPLGRSDLVDRWPGSAAVAESLLATLSGEGLIRNVAVGTYDGLEGSERWVVTEIGEDLLVLLAPDGAKGAQRSRIHVEVVGSRVEIVNQGETVARLNGLTIKGGMATVTLIPTDSVPGATPLAPGERRSLPIVMIPPGPAVVRAEWTDAGGPQDQEFSVTVR